MCHGGTAAGASPWFGRYGPGAGLCGPDVRKTEKIPIFKGITTDDVVSSIGGNQEGRPFLDPAPPPGSSTWGWCRVYPPSATPTTGLTSGVPPTDP